jgi:hypothetical protein
MSTNAPCPTPLLLSQYLDHEVESSAVQQISHHVKTCSRCHTQLQKMERVDGGMKTMLSKSPLWTAPTHTPSPACLSPEIVTAYIDRVLSREEALRAEQHLQTCDWCVQEVADATRMVAAFATPTRLPVPAALKQKVAAGWEPSRVEKATAVLSRLVVQVAKKGMALIEQHLVPPFLNVEEVLAPAGAYRTAEGPTTLDLNIKTEQTEIHVTSVQEGEGMSLRLTFLDLAQEALAGQRVFLRQQGRPIFSAKTDQQGVLRTPHLEPGMYEIDCPGTRAAFALEVRS